MSEPLSSNPVRYYALHSGALVEVHHPEFASYPVYVSDDDYQQARAEIERLTARVAELESYLMRIDVCSLDKEFMRKLAGEALYGKRTADETSDELGAPRGEAGDRAGPLVSPLYVKTTTSPISGACTCLVSRLACPIHRYDPPGL